MTASWGGTARTAAAPKPASGAASKPKPPHGSSSTSPNTAADGGAAHTRLMLKLLIHPTSRIGGIHSE